MFFVQVVARHNLIGVLLTEFYCSLGVALEAHTQGDCIQTCKHKNTITDPKYQISSSKGISSRYMRQGKAIFSKFF